MTPCRAVQLSTAPKGCTSDIQNFVLTANVFGASLVEETKGKGTELCVLRSLVHRQFRPMAELDRRMKGPWP